MTDGSASVKARGSTVRLDFAETLRDHLVVYGWILGLATRISRAEIRYGNVTIDLMSLAVPVPRPDVTQHFGSQSDSEGDNHGFYLSVALPASGGRPGYLRLAVTNTRAETDESVWPVTSGAASALSIAQHHGATIDWLLRNLSTIDASQLRALMLPVSGTAISEIAARSLGLDLAVQIEACCLVDERVLMLVGWCDARYAPLTAVTITVGNTVLDCLDAMTFAPQGGAAVHGLRGESVKLGLTWAGVIPPVESDVVEVVLEFRAGARHGLVRRTLATGFRQEMEVALQSQDPDGALGLIGRVADLVKDATNGPVAGWLLSMETAAVERLPVAWENRQPQVLMHCDAAVPIADAGVYITGWLYAEDTAVLNVAYSSGTQRLRLDDHWIRQGRSDVTAHLNNLGLPDADAEHAFLCYVPFANRSGPHHLTITLTSGSVCRIRLPSIAATTNPLHSVRAVLTSFAPSHRALRTLLDTHVGPAVAAAWGGRRRPAISKRSHRFGPVISKPAVSVIVPLFARHDLADYQLAAFADDPDFQSLELIYFVDDPSIHDAFRAQCHDLYEIYRVPFTVAFAGVNLGFAGANNCAARLATGQHLLLLNSDVLPKRNGWVRDLLVTYATLQSPGFLGVKLLYEDGSVQHAGMTFQRHAPWSDMWVNYHPHKGQSAEGLHGLREVDAVTAACALVNTELYRALGGLSEDYIIGDFEDSDFCLRAAAAGRRHWVTLDVELYHLERQSQARIGDAHWRTNLTLFNCWQHQQRWGALLEKQAQ